MNKKLGEEESAALKEEIKRQQVICHMFLL